MFASIHGQIMKQKKTIYIYADFEDFIKDGLEELRCNLSDFDQTLLQVFIVRIVLNARFNILQDSRQTVLEGLYNIHLLLVILDKRCDRLHSQETNLN